MTRIAAFLLLLALTGYGADSGAEHDSKEEAAMPRPFQPENDSRWIGNAICYGPHRDGQRPGLAEPSAAELREDLHLMVRHWNLLRTYSSSGFTRTMLELIRDEHLDMKVMLGVWVAPDDAETNRREIETAIELAHAFPGIIIAVCVGNETQVDWSGHRCPPERLIEQVHQVRAGVAVPVTTADDFNFWNKPESRAIAAELDFITLHAHPLWNGKQLDEGLVWLKEQVAVVRALHPEREIVLGETGWATAVADEGEQAELIKGVPGEDEQRQFLAAVTAWAAAESLTTFWFEAFDENWKGGPHPAEVEKHWGLFRADRTPKAAMVVAPDEE